jgi:hypothetical protein
MNQFDLIIQEAIIRLEILKYKLSQEVEDKTTGRFILYMFHIKDKEAELKENLYKQDFRIH